MEYLKAAAELKKLITYTNSQVLNINKTGLIQKQAIVTKGSNQHPTLTPLQEFTNEAVKSAISESEHCSAFAITDVATMNVKGKKLSYYLYKGYHNQLEKGLVFYQPFNENTFEPIGEMQFSNGEENIFFDFTIPKFEESSCNALETKNHTKNKPEIAFLIGHTNLGRLTYDIQRLIIDTANNVSKNLKVDYKFIIQASLFGAKELNSLQNTLAKIEQDTKKYIEPEYVNAKFIFEVGE